MIVTTKNKELAIFGQSLTETKGNLIEFIEAFKHGGINGQNGIIDTLFSMNKKSSLTPELSKNFEGFKQTFNTSSLSAEAVAEQIKNVDSRIIDYAKTCKNGEMTTAGFKEALNNMSLSAKAGKIALGALSTAGSMIAFMAITKGIELAVKGIDSLIETQKEAAEALANAKSVSDSYKSSINDIISSQDELSSSADSISDSYAKLSQGVNTNTNENIGLSNDDYEEFLNLNSQLADLFPSLIKGYDENGNAILGLGGNVDTVTGKIQALVEQQDRLSNKEILGNLENYVNGDDDGGGQLEEIKRLEKKKKEAEDLIKVYDDVRRMFDTEEAGDVNKITGISSGAIDSLMKKAGFAPELATLDTSGFWQFELNESEMSHLKETLATYYGELISESQTAKDELTSANAEMSSEMMYWVQSLSQYTGSDEDMQTAMMNMVQGIDWSLVGADDYEGAKTAIQKLVLTPLSEMSGDPATQKQFSTALSSLFSLNLSDMPVGQAEEIVSNYILQIMDMLNQFRPEDSQLSLDEVYSMFGMSDYQNPTDKMLSSFHSIAHGNTADMQKLSDYTKEFTLAQQQAWLSATLGAKNADDAIKKYEDSLKNSSSASTPASFSQAWDSIGTTGTVETKNAALEAKEKMLELARAGKLTEKELRNSSIADVFKNAGVSIEEATGKINHMVDASDQLSSMKSGIRSISDVLAQKKENLSNKETKEVGIDADTLAGFDADIKGLDSWKEFEKTLGNGKKDMDACQKAANKLATEWVNSNNFLSQLDNTNKDYYISTLKEMGVKNAEQIVTEALNQTISKENKEKINLVIATIDLSNGIQNSEVTALSNEISWLSTASAATKQYYLQKLLANENSLTTSESTANLVQLAKQAGITGEAIAELTKLLEMQRAYEKMAENVRKGNIKSGEALNDFAEQIKKQKKRVDRAANKKPDVEIEKINGKSSSTTTAPTNPSPDKTAPDKTKTKSTQVIDWISRRLEVLQSAIDLTKAKFENLFSLKSQKSNLNKQITQTTELLRSQRQAATKYQKKANNIKISSDKKENASLKKKVRNGEITGNMSELIATYGQKTANKIQKYQDFYTKAKEASDAAIESQTNLYQLYQKKIDIIADHFAEIIDKFDAVQSRIQSAINLTSKINGILGKGEHGNIKSYEGLLESQAAEIEKLRKEKKKTDAEYNRQIQETSEERYEIQLAIMQGSGADKSEIKAYKAQHKSMKKRNAKLKREKKTYDNNQDAAINQVLIDMLDTASELARIPLTDAENTVSSLNKKFELLSDTISMLSSEASHYNDIAYRQYLLTSENANLLEQYETYKKVSDDLSSNIRYYASNLAGMGIDVSKITVKNGGYFKADGTQVQDAAALNSLSRYFASIDATNEAIEKTDNAFTTYCNTVKSGAEQLQSVITSYYDSVQKIIDANVTNNTNKLKYAASTEEKVHLINENTVYQTRDTKDILEQQREKQNQTALDYGKKLLYNGGGLSHDGMFYDDAKNIFGATWVDNVLDKELDDETFTKVLDYLKQIGREDSIENLINWQTELKSKKQTELDIQALDDNTQNIIEEGVAEIFNVYKEEFERSITGYEDILNDLNDKISLATANGRFITSQYYKNIQAEQIKEKAVRDEQVKNLTDYLNEEMEAGNIIEGDDVWYDLTRQIQDAADASDSLSVSIAETAKSMREADRDLHDRAIQEMDRLNSEADFYQSIINRKDAFDENGNITTEGMASISLSAGKISTNIAMIREQQKEMAELREDIANHDPDDGEGLESLTDRYHKLEDSVYDYIQACYTENDAIGDLIEQGLNAQLDALNKVIEKYKKALNEAKNLRDYNNTIEEQTKNISSIEKQLQALEGNDSEEGRAKRQALSAQLQDAKKELEDTEYEKYLQDQEDMLDTLSEDYQDFIEQQLEQIDQLVSQVVSSLQENTSAVVEAIQGIDTSWGTELSTSLKSMLKSGDYSTTEDGVNSISNAEIQAGIVYLDTKKTLETDTLHQTGSPLDLLGQEAKSRINAAINAGGGGSSGDAELDNFFLNTFGKRLNPYAISELKTQFRVSSNEDLIKALTAYGFASGGIAHTGSGTLKKTGEDGFVLARNGEGFVSPEDVPEIRKLLDNVPVMKHIMDTFSPLHNLPVPVNTQQANSVNIGTVSQTIELPNVTDTESFIREATNNPKMMRFMDDAIYSRMTGDSSKVNRW